MVWRPGRDLFWSWISGSPGRLQPAGTLGTETRLLAPSVAARALRASNWDRTGWVGLGRDQTGWLGRVASRCVALRCVALRLVPIAALDRGGGRYGRREGRIGRSLCGPPHVQLRRGHDTTGRTQARIFLPQASNPNPPRFPATASPARP